MKWCDFCSVHAVLCSLRKPASDEGQGTVVLMPDLRQPAWVRLVTKEIRTCVFLPFISLIWAEVKQRHG
ncbi:MAG: hypothetical protein CL862_13675 [Cyanobium sp. NAT70]|nr:hypothetical protein [Cyanobium sp. NAT70]